MELTFKVVLDQRHKRKSNTYSLKLRVYQDRDYKECSLGIDITEVDWDCHLQMVLPSNSNHKIFNTKLTSIKSRVRKFILFNEDEPEIITAAEVIEQVKRKQLKKIINKPDIIKYGKEHIANLQKLGNIGNAICYSCAINKLGSFLNKETLLFEEINYQFLEKFNAKLLAEGLKINSIALYLRTLRALFKRAIKEEILEPKYYPFTNFKIKHETTINRNLSITEIKNIINHPLIPKTNYWHHRNLFLLSFCFIGVNFTDLLTLRKDSFVDGRLIFRRKKTHKVYSILIQPVAKDILNEYLSLSIPDSSEFVLPFVKNTNDPIQLKNKISQAVKNTNANIRKIASLATIEKKITTYYARYTWANIAKGLGYSKDMIAEALGHNYGNKVTGIYLDNYSNEIIDEINKKVLDTCFAP